MDTKFKSTPVVCVAASVAITVVYTMLPNSIWRVLLLLGCECAIYAANCMASGQHDLPSIRILGVTCVILSSAAALCGLFSWFLPLIHVIMTLVCEEIKLDEADPSWPKEKQEAYLRERHRRVL